MHCRWIRLLTATVLTTAIVRNSGAQEPRPLTHPDSIPYELAVSLIGAAFGPEPEVMVGSAPGWAMQRLFVPTNGRVLGSAYLGTTVTTVIELPVGPDSAASEQVRSELMRRGWTEPPRPNFGGGGFRPAAMASPGVQSTTRFTLCNADYAVSGDVRRHAGVSLFLVYRLASATTGICHPPQFQARAGTPIRLPTLYEPAGTQDARASMACYPQSVGESNGTEAFFRTPMSADQILAHFARQLADSGWTRVRDTVTLARGEWTRPDSSGAAQRLTLTITAPQGVSDAQCHQAEMRVALPRKP